MMRGGYIDLDGKEVVPIKYQVSFGEGETPTDFSEGLAALPLRTDEYDSPVYGYIDKMGNEVIPAKFSIAGDFKNGIALVDLENYIDKTGKVLTGNELEFQDKIVIFSQDEKMGLRHLNGKVVVPCNYDVIQNFSDGMAAVCKGHLWGYVDPLETFVIPCSYHSSNYYDNGVMDDWGEYGAPDEANDFHEGLVMVMRNRMAGFLNKQGKTVIPFVYKRAKDFSEGLAAVKTSQKWGFVDKEGNNVIPCQYDTVASFKEGLVAAVKNGKCGYINASGQEVVPFIFDKPAEFEPLHDFCEGLAVIKKNGVYGYVDKEGKSTFDVAANNISKPKAVEVMPSFPGGQQGLMEWFNSNFQVPAEAVRDRAVGKTVVSFVVSKTGEVTNVEILESVHPAIDEVAKKLFVKMPRWTPGTLDGVPVNVKYSMPFNVNTIQ